MDLSILSTIFKVVLIAIIYIIIMVALRIMYKDLKGGNKKITKKTIKKHGFEVVKTVEGSNIKKGAVIMLEKEINLGRNQDNDVILKDRYVSSYHARIFRDDKEIVLVDLNSTNGTYLNEEKINEENVLEKGDLISIGETTFRYLG